MTSPRFGEVVTNCDHLREGWDVTKELIRVERIERSILVIRGLRVMIDADLARLYGVATSD